MKKPARRTRWAVMAVCVLVVVGLVAGLGAGAALGQDESPAADDGKKTVLTIGLMNDADSMNPFIGWANQAYEVFTNEYLLLCGRDTETLKQDDKGVAKSWEISEDGLTWTFSLNEGLTWHDGEPLNADDVAFTINYIVENEMAAFIGYLSDVEKAVVVDDYTVDIVCKQPKADLERLWQPIMPEHIWSEIPAEDAGAKFKNEPPVIGSGPWQVVEHKPSDYTRMVANEDFWMGAPKIDEVVYAIYKNPDSMVQDLKAGSIDAIYLFPQVQYEELEDTPGIDVAKYTWFNWDYIGINCYEGDSKGHPALRDKDFRAALEYAIDRQSIIDTAYYGYAVPGYTYMPPDNWKDPDYSWQPPDGVRRDFDLATANDMLDQAGYLDTDGDGIREYEGENIELRMWANSAYPESERSAKLIAGWFRDIGVDVRLAAQTDAVYYDKIWNYEGDTFVPDFDLYLWQWDGFYDAGQTLNCFTTAQIEGWNELGWSNEEYDRLSEEQQAEFDPDERAAMLQQMQQVMYEDCSVIVLVHPYKLAAYNTDKWQGWQRANYGKGAPYGGWINPWPFYNVQPRTATVAEDGSNVGLWVGIGVGAAVVIAVIAFFFARSRRSQSVEED